MATLLNFAKAPPIPKAVNPVPTAPQFKTQPIAPFQPGNAQAQQAKVNQTYQKQQVVNQAMPNTGNLLSRFLNQKIGGFAKTLETSPARYLIQSAYQKATGQSPTRSLKLAAKNATPPPAPKAPANWNKMNSGQRYQYVVSANSPLDPYIAQLAMGGEGAGVGELGDAEAAAESAAERAVGKDVNKTPLQLAEEAHQAKLKANNLTQNEYAGLHDNVTQLDHAQSQAHTAVNQAFDAAPRDATGKLTPKGQTQVKQAIDAWGKAQDDHLAALNKVRVIDGEKPIVLGESPALPKGTPKNASTPEAPKVGAGQGSEQLSNKESKFIGTVKKSEEVSPATKEQVTAQYTPGTNAEKLANSESAVKKGLDYATAKTMVALGKKTGSISPQEVSDAIAVAKAHDAAGNFEQASQIYDKLAEHGSAAGQKIQALSLLSNRTPEGMHYSALKVLKSAGVTPDEALSNKIQSAIDEVKKTDPGTNERDTATQKLVKVVNSNIPRSKMAATVGIWRVGLLTGPETLAKVGVSHAVTAPVELASRPVSAAVDKLTSLVTGKRAFTSNPVSDLGTFVKGQIRGLKAIPTKLRTGLDVPNTGGFDTKLGESTHQTPYEEAVLRAHGTAFKPNYSGAYDVSLKDQARVEATNQELKGAEKQTAINKLLQNPTTAMKNTATAEAEKFTNMNKTDLGNLANKLQDVKVGGVPVGKVLVPFARIPTAIATKGIVDWTPLGLGRGVMKVIQGIRTGTFDQRAFSQIIGRSLTGTTATGAVGYELMQHGMMTLSAPSDPKEKALWLAEGKQENSIKIGGKWISLNAFGPAGIAIGLGGAFSNAIKSGQNPVNAIATATAAAGKLVSQQPYMKGIAGASNALNNPQEYAKTFVDSLIGSSIPAVSAQIASGSDKSQRAYTPGVINTLQSRIPGQREKLPAQKDMFGSTLPSGNGGSIVKDIIGTVNPFYPSQSRNQSDPVTKELQRLYNTQGSSSSPSIATPTKLTIEGHPAKASSANINTLESTAGPAIHSTLMTLISSPQYQQLPDADKTNAINSVITTAKQTAESENATKFTVQPAKKGSAPLPPLQNLTAGGTTTGSGTATKALTTEQLALNKTAFDNSGKSFSVIGGNVYTKDAAGNDTVTPQITYNYNLGTATLTQQKDAGDLSGWMTTAQNQLNLIVKQLNDPTINSNPLQVTKLQNDASTIQTDMAKYTAYGGFTSSSSSSSSKPKVQNYKTSGGTAIKAYKPKAIAVKGGKATFKAPHTTGTKTKSSTSKIAVKGGKAPKAPKVGVAAATKTPKKSLFGEA